MKKVTIFPTFTIIFLIYFNISGAQNLESDWVKRSTHTDVVLATNFDAESEVLDFVLRNPDHPNYNLTIWDQSTKVSGGGSIKMIIPKDQGIGGTNDWRRNFSDVDGMGVSDPAGKFRGFGPGDLGTTFFIQWRQRFSLVHLDNIYKLSSGRGGWKMINIGEGDEYPWISQQWPEETSAQVNEIVMNNAELRLFPSMYHSVVAFAPVDEGIDSRQGGYGYQYDSKVQNAIDRGSQYTLLRERYVLQSSFRNDDPIGNAGPYTFTNHPPIEDSPGVIMFYPDEWMTFQIGVTLGPLGSAPSSIEGSPPREGWTDCRIEAWVAREGQPSVKIIDRDGITLRRGAGTDGSDPEGYGKAWFTVFHTGLESDPEGRDDAETWFDELIVSKSKIADPLTFKSNNPDAPDNVRVKK